MITIDEPGAENLAPDFDNPLGLIKACHERILFHCDLLEKIMRYLAENETDKEAIDAIQRVSRYFNTAGKLHHQDEEVDVFPRLIRDSVKLADIVNTLRQDHTNLDTLWHSISAALEKPGAINPEQLIELTKIITEFCNLNRKHLQVEEEELLTIATHLISNDDLKAIGQSMKDRRNL